ncbi:MAG: translation initiation factor IF-2 [Planctomycetes bacterium]|nr:translation initiation factor IF-2 [Planctomycetota bacterium]
MAATRVYILAKELGVKSAAIVEKCRAEDLDVKNHMSTISAGLAATIREWFSEGEHTTTVEATQKVDLKKVRIRKKPVRKRVSKKTKEEEPVAEAEAHEAIEVSEEQPAAAVAVAEEKPKKKKKPKKPEPIVPAGPMLKKPAPAKLSGPQVVRVEEPEILSRPKPKKRTRYDAPATEPLITEQQKIDQPALASDKDKKKHKDRTHGRRHKEQEQDSESAKKGKFTNQRRQRDIEERRARLDAAGGEGLRVRPRRKIAAKSYESAVPVTRPEKATVSEPVLVKDLSAVLAVKTTDIIRKLMGQGIMASINHAISPDVAELIALELGTELTVERKSSLEDQIKTEFEERPRKHLKSRSVVVTMLGHVDHGKTSLLDKIRSTQVTATEAGGITQHIGAYQIKHGDDTITFLDTPGHEAFTAMRARGANMTDVVVLVIAADDGVMPQTIEAIAHSKAAGVPIIVALNKIDLPGVDINRIYAQLSEHELTPAEWGGDTEVVKTSATTGEGVDDLLEHLDYISDLLELKADDTIEATGWVVEAKMSAQRGPIATFLIKEGKLSKSAVIFAGNAYGRIKTLRNSFGKIIKTATSSMPVEVTGLSDVPQAGDRFYCLKDINRAKTAAEENQTLSRESSLAKRTQITLDNLFSQIEAGNVKELNIIIRADVQGSVDVLTKYLSDLSTEEVKIKILHAAPGGVTEGDVVLAEASNAIIIGFNVVPEEHVTKIAESKGVDIRLYTIIYRITEDLHKSMEGLLDPEEQEKNLGRATIRTTFKVSKIGTIAGCYVNEGIVKKKAKVRLIRDNIVIRDDLTMDSLKHFKDDAREVKAGLECGIKLAKFDDIKVDDVLDFFEIIEVARTL